MKHTMRQPKSSGCELNEISYVQFSSASKEQIEKLAVVELTQQHFYERETPIKGGVFDMRMGISDPKQKCQTCGESAQCQGHFGAIYLQEPILHYGMIKILSRLLRCICHRCCRIKRGNNKEIRTKMKDIKRIYDPSRRLALMEKLIGGIKKCGTFAQQQDLFDKHFQPCASISPTKISVKNYKISYIDENKRICYFQRRDILRLLQGLSYYQPECEALGFTKTKPIDLIIQTLLVPPPQIRPHVLINNQFKCEDDLSVAYLKVIKLNRQLQRKKTQNQRIQIVNTMEKLVASIMIKLRTQKSQSNVKKGKQGTFKKIRSISQRLTGKEGRFRQNLLGKRVDYAARTVITPDPFLDLNQIGVPYKIANSLTYPQKVNAYNYDKIVDLCLQKRVKYLIYPPEFDLKNEQRAINVRKIQASTREEMSGYVSLGMVAQRCLQNGDHVLVNRQPTLHRMSMMTHKVRILPYNSFRINLSVCMPYNADFDGDQMNIHVPQSYQSLSELKNVSIVQNQIVGPKNGTTTMGFSQDSLIGAYLITSRDTFLSKEDIMNLAMWINHGGQDRQIQLPCPAIIKPQPLWTGKQIISIILPQQLQIRCLRSKVRELSLSNLQENSLIILKGQVITGILQKQFIGSSSSLNNIIHYIWMEKGPHEAQFFINNLQKIAYNWLIMTGLSLGAADIVPEKQLIAKKMVEFEQVNKLYYKIFNQFRDQKQVKIKHLHQQGKKIEDSFEYNVNLQLNNRLSKIQQIVKKVENSSINNIYKIVEAKSKGSQTNLAQIIYSVGNQNINGKRCPQGFQRRSLPHFCKDDNSPVTRGYVISSFYEGLKPHQLFFHSMAGRQGLSDTAIKTSNVGYIQRKIVKSLQDLIVKYDTSVRDSKNNLLQNLYGEDGFSPQFIQKHHFFGAECPKNRFRQLFKWKQDQLRRLFKYTPQQLKILKKQYSKLYKSRKMYRQIYCTNVESLNYEYFSPISVQRLINKVKSMASLQSGQIISPLQICKAVQKLLQSCLLPSEKYLQEIRKYNIGSINSNSAEKEDEYQSFSDDFEREDEDSTKMYNKSQKFQHYEQCQIFKLHLRFNLSSKKLYKSHKLSIVAFEKIIQLIKQKYFKSLAPAGQAVGCLASQSIGQPITQMTLNTFHLAGISDRNVTLGLPRLQQLLNCPQQIPTPMLTLFPSRPILDSQKSKPQNQSFLLEMLLHTLPERKICDFIQSTRFYYDSVGLTQKMLSQSSSKQKRKRTPCKIVFSFSCNKIGSYKIWQQIVGTFDRMSCLGYELQEIIDFDQVQESRPQIAIRILEGLAKLNDKKGFKIFTQMHSLQSALKQVRVCGLQGINTVRLSKKSLCLDAKNQIKQYVVFQAFGKDLKKCLSHKNINSFKSYSNNIQEIAKILGIEAARQALINELKQVLKPYGIVINYRHLSVLADWMCVRGILIPLNRNGFNKLRNISTFTKASFEQASNTLFNAAIFSTKDDLKDTSQKIIFGQLTECGTSQCQIIINPEKVANFTHRSELVQKQMAKVYQQTNFWDKTPQYLQQLGYQNKGSFYQSSTHGRSPNLSVSPVYSCNMPSFSPTYLPDMMPSGLRQKSSRYQGLKVASSSINMNSNMYSRYGGDLRNNMSQLSSPSYLKTGHTSSPSYADLVNRKTNKKMKETKQMLNKQIIKKYEEQSCDSYNQETQQPAPTAKGQHDLNQSKSLILNTCEQPEFQDEF